MGDFDSDSLFAWENFLRHVQWSETLSTQSPSGRQTVIRPLSSPKALPAFSVSHHLLFIEISQIYAYHLDVCFFKYPN